MPSLNVRLTAEEHDELRAAARAAGRSIQEELVFRLFPPPEPPKRRGRPPKVRVADEDE